ncbi:unnamed protein product, partial [Brenthis ino]
MSKRKRDPTFTISEKEALLDLIKTHFSIVESKKTDAVSMKSKTEEWRKIATEFNAISGIYPRDWTVLKNCWENLKKKAKHEQTLRNQHYLGTGGGPPKKDIEDPIVNRVLELIQARVSGFVNCFDSDGTQILAGSAPEIEKKLNDDKKADQLEVVLEKLENGLVSIYSKYAERKKNPGLRKTPSPDVQQQHSQVCHALSTPPRVQTPSVAALAATTSRRRALFKETSGTPDLIKGRIKTLLKANVHADEEHEMKIKILRIQEEKEKEILKLSRRK